MTQPMTGRYEPKDKSNNLYIESSINPSMFDEYC